MKPWNATFRPLSSYADAAPTSLPAISDFARALEDLAWPVVQPWAVMTLDDERRPPSPEAAVGAPRIAIGAAGPLMRAWLGAHLRVPELARLFPSGTWGTWRVQFDSDGLGDVYADGRLVHERLFLHGMVDLGVRATPDACPWVAYSLDTTIQRVALEMARCCLTGLDAANSLVRDVARSLRTAASLLDTDNPRVNRFISGQVAVNRSDIGAEQREHLRRDLAAAVAQIDLAAWRAGRGSEFLASLERCREALAPLADFAKQFHLFLLGVSHMDLAWKWRWPESVACMHGTLKNQAALMRAYPDFTFLESSPPVWYAIEERDPELFAELKHFARRGQFEPAGGMWCEPDCQMLGAESWVRQTLFGQRAAREVCGVQSRAGHNTDAFGFSWALPKIYAQAEMEAFLTQKLRYNQFTVFEDVLFWWESDDGTRVLGIHTYPDHYQEIDPDEMAQAVRIFNLTSGVRAAALLFGIGNHGGGPLPDMLERIADCQRQTVYPTVHMAGMNEYLDHLKAHESRALAALPVIRDELFLECHHKTYTVQAAVKAANREAERELYHTEALAVMARESTVQELAPAWRILLFNQFHDILPGTSFPSVYQDVFKDYNRLFDCVDHVQERLMDACFVHGDRVQVVNTLPWRRRAAVTFEAEDAPPVGLVTDDTGRHIPFQRTGDGEEVVAVLPELPAFGVRSLRKLRAARGTVDADDFAWGENWVQNRFFRVEFDPARGLISSLRLADGTELAGDGVGRLDLLEDNSEGVYQTWNMNLSGREDPACCERFELIEAGPVRVRFRAHLSFVRWEKKKEFMVPIMWNTPGVDYPTSFFTVDTVIYRELPTIECRMEADWWEDDTVLKVAADTTLAATRAFYGIPFGQIERSTARATEHEKARYEVPAGNWADLSDGRHGLAILNTGRHGHDALAGRLRLSLLTSPYGGEKVHVPDPLADRGEHRIGYAFYPHAGGPEEGDVARTAVEYEFEPRVVLSAESSLPVGKDLLCVDPDQFLVCAVKPAEEGDAFIVRGYEPKGRDAALTIAGALAAGERQAVNFLEHEAGPCPETLRPHQVVSVRIAQTGNWRDVR